jgi:SAM-dependent methyltransferase
MLRSGWMTDTERPEGIESEIASGKRFEFGANWRAFFSVLNEKRIALSQQTLQQMLEVEKLSGARFLDVGSGSGLFSLAARRLGARVHSFDYDPSSVACTEELKRRFFPGDPEWTITQGSILDRSFIQSLGLFDVVYAWGVLHHTGALHQALENAAERVASEGKFFVAIYNDQGLKSVLWRKVKRLYCSSTFGRWMVVSIFVPYFVAGGIIADLAERRSPLARYRSSAAPRIHDWFDWLGGLPFEVAKPEEIFDFLRRRGFRLNRLVTCGGKSGCNQFVFIRDGTPSET